MITPYYERPGVTVFCADCLEVMPWLPPNSVDTIITDPPYGLTSKHGLRSPQYGEGGKKNYGETVGGFMGMKWDSIVPGPLFWSAMRRVAKPGAMLLAFGGTRTHHRLMCAIEDAGWEIRDCLMWLYGSGFPKSHNVGNAVDKSLGCSNRGHAIASGSKYHPTTGKARAPGERLPRYEGRTDEGKEWDGWGTALKPAWEPIILAMNPLDGTFAHNALEHGVAGLWVDGGRIGTDERPARVAYGQNKENNASQFEMESGNAVGTTLQGRWPANLILDEVAAAMLDEQSGMLTSGKAPASGFVRNSDKHRNAYAPFAGNREEPTALHGDRGGASRFFYVPKASRSERDNGLYGVDPQKRDDSRNADQPSMNGGEGNPYNRGAKPVTNNHPTVKPLALIRYLVRLTKTPTGGVVLDPFLGSGTTAVACSREGRSVIGIDIGERWCEIAVKRLAQMSLFEGVQT